MEKNITAVRVVNSILMDFDENKQYLVVEGTKDYKLYSKFFNKEFVCIKEGLGCSNVVEILKIFRQRGYYNNIGIIDSDFRRILKIEDTLEGLFLTDYHDMEVQIILTEAFENCLRKYLKDEKIKKFEVNNSSTLRSIIFQLAKHIGILKLANKKHNLGLLFKPKSIDGNQIKYKEFINEKNLQYMGDDCLIKTVINYSRNKSETILKETEIIEAYKNTSENEYDLLQLINGHDLTNIIYIFIKKTLSSTMTINSFNDFEDDLILAYEYGDFKNTSLYKAIKSYKSDELNLFK